MTWNVALQLLLGIEALQYSHKLQPRTVTERSVKLTFCNSHVVITVPT
jgi:hypothetical protein